MVLGFSSLVGASVAIWLFMALRVASGLKPAGMDWVRLGAFTALAVLYYLQMRVATHYQIGSVPDVYAPSGLDFAVGFVVNILRILQRSGIAVTAVAELVLLISLVALQDMRALRGMLFGIAVVGLFALLAVMGHYPAASERHVAWSIGIYVVLVALAADLLAKSWGTGRIRARFRMAGTAIFCAILAIETLQALPSIPQPAPGGPNAVLIAALEDLPPSDIVPISGACALWPSRGSGAPIGHHRYAPIASLESAEMDPAYFTEAYLDRDPVVLVEDIVSEYAAPDGWVRASILMRLSKLYTPLPEYLLRTVAPRDGRTFYILGAHDRWGDDRRFAALVEVLAARNCRYAPAFIVQSRLSGGFLMEVTCPAEAE